uniref:Zinc finger protein CONSTANS-LIKE 10 n=1 Tax=Lagerstroemia indica TaxID=141186 RepID=A0A097DC51_9MYRT|nr:zinc finger protein CONSTANS-LIKE 10 [Lagerstroemia indica]
MKHDPKQRLCDYCGAASALLYCRPDSAKLCLRCDRDVHSTNPLFTKHTRSLLCDFCDSASASVFCETHRSVLCSSCDWDAHDGVVHNRRPVEGFSGCPSASEILGALGFDEIKGTLLGGEEGVDGFVDSVLWETPTFVSLDDLIVSSENFGGLQAFDVPPLPKNRNATCGKHKEEILRQIRLLERSETCLNFENADVLEPVGDLQFQDAGPTAIPEKNCLGFKDHWESLVVPDHEAVAFQWLSDDGDMKNQASNSLALLSSYHEGNLTNPEEKPEVGSLSCANESEGQPENPVSANTPPVLPRVSQYDLNSQERESAISRYKEKRKTRRYDKHIRYESRKARAESRTRVRGRFAKVNHHV